MNGQRLKYKIRNLVDFHNIYIFKLVNANYWKRKYYKIEERALKTKGEEEQ